jgi:ribosomal protein L28
VLANAGGRVLLRGVGQGTMARAHNNTRRTIGTQERIDRMVSDTLRRFFTIVLSASGLVFIICYLGSIR